METTPAPDHSVIPFTIGNGGGGTTYGFELSADYRPVTWWYVRASYAFLKNDFETPQGGSSLNGDTPEQQFTLENRLNLRHNVEVDVILRYVDQLPDLNIDDYVTVDLRLAWRPTEDLELAVVGRNLLEQEHSEFVPTIIFTAPTAVERSVYGKITWRF